MTMQEKHRDCTWDKAKVAEERNLYQDCLRGILNCQNDISPAIITMLNSISIINFIAVYIWSRLGNILAKLNLIIFLPLRFDKTK